MQLDWSTADRRLNSLNAIDSDADRDDIELLARFQINEALEDHQFGVCGRASGTTDDETAYELMTYETTSQELQIRILRVVDGTGVLINTSLSKGTYVAGDWFYMRFRINGSDLKGKLWRISEEEPSAWDLEETDSNITGVGWGGLWGFRDSGDSECDYLAIGTNGDTAPLDADDTDTVRLSAAYAAVLSTDPDTPVRISAAYAAVLSTDPATPVRISAAYAAVLYSAPPDPVSPAAFLPLPTPFKVSFERKLQRLAFHYLIPVARVTHLTASVLFDQALPTTRATQLNVAVIYGNPTSQGLPEVTPAPKVKRIEFTRTLQQPLELNEHPPPPPGLFQTNAKSLKSSFTRQLQVLAIPPEYPETPKTAEDYGGYTRFPSGIKIKYSRQIQPVLIPPVYPETPFGQQWGFWPGQLTLTANKITYQRGLQQPLELDERPTTAAGFRWPRPPPPTFTASFKRQVQKLPELDVYPPTPPAFFEGFFPAPFRVKRIPATYHREAKRVLDPHVYPPAGTFAGFWPANKRVEANRTAFARRRQLIPELDRYAETPKSAEAYAGHTPVPSLKSPIKWRIQPVLNPHVYPPTPAGFFDGFWPGSKAVESSLVKFTRILVKLPQHDQWTPPLPNVLALPQPANRVKFTRRVQTVIHPELPTATPPGFRWPRPPMPTFRIEFQRELARLPQHDQWTPTPPGFFEGQYPAAIRIEANRISFERLLQIPVLSRYQPIALVTAYRVLPTVRRRKTIFKAFAPPLLQLSRIFPPSFIIGDARWAMRAVYRRDIQRALQPVWNSSAIVGEAFRDTDPDCKWYADCATSVWIAQDDGCI